MNNLIVKLREKYHYKEISDQTLSLILLRCVDSIKKCYHRELETINNKKEYNKKISEIIYTHCYNQTHTTKSQLRRILQQILQPEIYSKFGVKLIYDILNIGETLTSEGSVIELELYSMNDNINPKLEKICSNILSRLNERMKEKAGHSSMIDPVTILIILSIVLTFIRILQECGVWSRFSRKTKTQQAHMMQEKIRQFSLRRSWLNRLRMNRVMRKYLTKEQYNFYGEELRESIMDVGVNVTEDEATVLMEAANV